MGNFGKGLMGLVLSGVLLAYSGCTLKIKGSGMDMAKSEFAPTIKQEADRLSQGNYRERKTAFELYLDIHEYEKAKECALKCFHENPTLSYDMLKDWEEAVKERK